MLNPKVLLTKYGMIFSFFVIAGICATIMNRTENYLTNEIFHVLFWIFFSPVILAFVFLMISGGVNYAREDFKIDNWFIRFWTKLELTVNTPFDVWTKRLGDWIKSLFKKK